MAYIGTGTLSPLIAYSQNVHKNSSNETRTLFIAYSQNVHKNSSNEGFYEDSQEICPILTNQQFSVLFVACR